MTEKVLEDISNEHFEAASKLVAATLMATIAKGDGVGRADLIKVIIGSTLIICEAVKDCADAQEAATFRSTLVDILKNPEAHGFFLVKTNEEGGSLQ